MASRFLVGAIFSALKQAQPGRIDCPAVQLVHWVDNGGSENGHFNSYAEIAFKSPYSRFLTISAEVVAGPLGKRAQRAFKGDYGAFGGRGFLPRRSAHAKPGARPDKTNRGCRGNLFPLLVLGCAPPRTRGNSFPLLDFPYRYTHGRAARSASRKASISARRFRVISMASRPSSSISRASGSMAKENSLPLGARTMPASRSMLT